MGTDTIFAMKNGVCPHFLDMKISEEYFSYLARNFPVMCLSDEFYFFPRAKKAIDSLGSLDSLDEEKIKDAVSYVRGLKGTLETLNPKDLEAQIDLRLLNQSISTFLREFDQIKIWQIDPNLYLKISLLGIHQILTKFSFIQLDIADCLLHRLKQIPRLLQEAMLNLKKIPASYLEVAIEMADASIDYFKTADFPLKDNPTLLKEINAWTKKAINALEDFKRFLVKRPSSTVIIKDRKLLEDILKDSFSYNRSLEEVFDIASQEYHKTLEELAEFAKKVNPKKKWQEILSTYRIDAKDAQGLLNLYSTQIKNIQSFIKEKDIITIPETQDIQVRFTPQFMKPIRASASYSSPITQNMKEPAYFYITAEYGKIKTGHISNVHNEYIFVTAHETFPGHHLLDSIRRSIANPIRQQIESPFFYEGWASYAERLIDQLGYIKDPIQKLLGLKRQAWRAVRAMLDVGIRIDRLKFGDAESLLKDLGYSARIAKFMFRHYSLSPGYQLCYTIGKFEIEKLKERFSSKLGLKRFHGLLLEGGQISFDLIEKRLNNLS